MGVGVQIWRLGTENVLGDPMVASHDLLLVLVSVCVACLAGFTALSVVERMVATRRPEARRWWLASGALAMGCAIWAMHFTGMLACAMGASVRYDPGVTLLSLVPAMLGSAAALRTMARPAPSRRHVLTGGLLLAAGIGCMHYTGMEAMRMGAELRYEPSLFAASLVVAYLLATAALSVRFVLPDGRMPGRLPAPARRILSAVLMGLAVTGMHYTAMAAARFYPGPPLPEAGTAIPTYALAFGVCMVTLAVLALVSAGAMIDRRLEAAGEAARASAEWAQTILDAAYDAILTLDKEGAVQSFSRRAEAIFGYAAGEIIGRSVRTLLPPEVFSGDQQLHERFGGTDENDLDGVSHRVPALAKDGTVVFVEFGMSVLLSDAGPLYVVSVRDISEQQRLEQELARAQKLESVGQLAAGIAHEINTPIQFVGDNLQFLRDGFASVAGVLDAQDAVLAGSGPDGAPPGAVDKLRDAADEADLEFLRAEIPTALAQSLEGVGHVARIVSAMRDFSHAGGRTRALADLNRAVENTLTVTRNLWKEVAEIETDLDPDLPQVACDVSEIHQVLLNLVTNAAHAVADANRERGETAGRIRVATAQADRAVEIRVADTGTGIPEAARARVFDPFFTTKDVGSGTGQGLAIAHDLITRKHGGQIDFETEAGRGTTFVIRLPLGEPA